MRKALIIYNPASGPLKNPSVVDSMRRSLRGERIQTVLLTTPFKEAALFSQLKEGIDRIVVAGGDGTLNMVVNCLVMLDNPPPLAVVPLGTANDFANSLGIDSVAMGVARAAAGEVLGVDVGKVHQTHFINVAAGGFLCDVAHGTDQKLKKTLGRIAYYLKGLLELSAVRPIELGVTVDGRQIFTGEAYLYLILNSKKAANFRSLAPEASLVDGKMDLLLLKKCPAPELMGVLLKVLAGRHIADPNIIYMQGKCFELESPAEVVTDLDGEEGPPLPWQVDILPQRLRFLR